MQSLLMSWWDKLAANRRWLLLIVLIMFGFWVGNHYFLNKARLSRFKDFRTDFSKTSIDLDKLVAGKINKNDSS